VAFNSLSQPAAGRTQDGGIRLTRAPEAICIGAVVRDLEEELAVLGCLDSTRNAGALPGYCRIEGGSVLRGALKAATEAFLATHPGGLGAAPHAAARAATDLR
jgi:Rrf2 family nitric oxide-sensitive transcriptional repressor